MTSHSLIVYGLVVTTPSASIHQEEEVPLLFMCATIVRDCITHKFSKMSVILQRIVAKIGAICFTEGAARYASQKGFELKVSYSLERMS